MTSSASQFDSKPFFPNNLSLKEHDASARKFMLELISCAKDKDRAWSEFFEQLKGGIGNMKPSDLLIQDDEGDNLLHVIGNYIPPGRNYEDDSGEESDELYKDWAAPFALLIEHKLVTPEALRQLNQDNLNPVYASLLVHNHDEKFIRLNQWIYHLVFQTKLLTVDMLIQPEGFPFGIIQEVLEKGVPDWFVYLIDQNLLTREFLGASPLERAQNLGRIFGQTDSHDTYQLVKKLVDRKILSPEILKARDEKDESVHTLMKLLVLKRSWDAIYYLLGNADLPHYKLCTQSLVTDMLACRSREQDRLFTEEEKETWLSCYRLAYVLNQKYQLGRSFSDEKSVNSYEETFKKQDDFSKAVLAYFGGGFLMSKRWATRKGSRNMLALPSSLVYHLSSFLFAKDRVDHKMLYHPVYQSYIVPGAFDFYRAEVVDGFVEKAITWLRKCAKGFLALNEQGFKEVVEGVLKEYLSSDSGKGVVLTPHHEVAFCQTLIGAVNSKLLSADAKEPAENVIERCFFVSHVVALLDREKLFQGNTKEARERRHHIKKMIYDFLKEAISLVPSCSKFHRTKEMFDEMEMKRGEICEGLVDLFKDKKVDEGNKEEMRQKMKGVLVRFGAFSHVSDKSAPPAPKKRWVVRTKG